MSEQNSNRILPGEGEQQFRIDKAEEAVQNSASNLPEAVALAKRIEKRDHCMIGSTKKKDKPIEDGKHSLR